LLLAIAGLVSSTAYLGLVIVAAWRFRARAQLAGTAPSCALPVNVLIPLCGEDRRLEDCLESFFRQGWERFELTFGACDGSDPAWDVVHRLEQKYPHVATRAVFSGDPVLPNPKVSALVPMTANTPFDHLVIADSDVRVSKDCLRAVVLPLSDPNV